MRKEKIIQFIENISYKPGHRIEFRNFTSREFEIFIHNNVWHHISRHRLPESIIELTYILENAITQFELAQMYENFKYKNRKIVDFRPEVL